MTPPFQYPPAPHVRRHGPQGYADYSSFRPWLRDEFSFRCVYCLLREQWGRVNGTFTIDHFVAVAIDPELENDYDNLLSACVTCNLRKGVRVLPDPLTVLTSTVVRVESDGTIHADANSEAARLIELLGLDSRESTRFRKRWIEIVALARQNPDLYRELMGYPDDLPNLRCRRPPGGNTRPAGVEQSAFARRERGELPSSY
jgi:HNH endonuclease